MKAITSLFEGVTLAVVVFVATYVLVEGTMLVGNNVYDMILTAGYGELESFMMTAIVLMTLFGGFGFAVMIYDRGEC